MTVKLDPVEVRAHLRRLGYCNITGEQLDEFIKDLKKLIKYDQHLLCTCGNSAKLSGSSYVDSTPETLRTYNSVLSPSGNDHTDIEQPQQVHTRHDSGSECKSTCVAPCSDFYDGALKTKKFTKGKVSHKTRSVEENLQETVKPKSSFIRPWNIQPVQQIGIPKRSDPVKLYHQYQDIWKQQKVPGEERHSDLRWCIRERMLGEDPQPRPTSQASFKGSTSRRHRKA